MKCAAVQTAGAAPTSLIRKKTVSAAHSLSRRAGKVSPLGNKDGFFIISNGRGKLFQLWRNMAIKGVWLLCPLGRTGQREAEQPGAVNKGYIVYKVHGGRGQRLPRVFLQRPGSLLRPAQSKNGPGLPHVYESICFVGPSHRYPKAGLKRCFCLPGVCLLVHFRPNQEQTPLIGAAGGHGSGRKHQHFPSWKE